MKNTYSKSIFFILILFSFGLSAQKKSGIWTKTSSQKVAKSNVLPRKSQPNKGDFYSLDLETLKARLKDAPKRGENSKKPDVLIDFPLANGTLETFKIKEASILHPDLQATMPNSRTYVGQSISNLANQIRFSITSRGLNTMLHDAKEGIQFIDPITFGGKDYMVYKRKDLPFLKDNLICGFIDEKPLKKTSSSKLQKQFNAGDGVLRTFRLAIAATVEYSQFHWQAAGLTPFDTEADKKDAVLDAMIVTMNRVNGVFENELSVTMSFVANNKDVIFINSDNFTNDDSALLIEESQVEIDALIGDANYDIGHTFSTGGGGLAQLNSPCSSGSKAKGVTGSGAPIGDSYDIDFVAHEIGHQFGAPHTFNGSVGNCAGVNRTASNAYEPGSGTTIMAYAGLCEAQNVQSQSDAYFHQKSLQMMWDNITSGSSTCATQTNTGNTAPTAEAGSNYTIPISTPYKLTGTATDADGLGSLTYTWEQYDLGAAGVPTETTATGPLVRSYLGTNNPVRYIPRLPDFLATGGSTLWEKLPAISRNLNFRLTVRDNDTRGGQTAVDNMFISTTTAAGPFLVTSQNTIGTTWDQGATETITWDVAGTTANGVNTANVNILLSTDGGLNFDTVLVNNTPNDGSQNITVPSFSASNCRVMVEAVGNIFFNINTEKFSIGDFITSCTTYNSGSNLNLAIPDGLGDGIDGPPLSTTLNIPSSGSIDYITVNVDVSHSYIRDLKIELVHPNGFDSAIIWDKTCDNENNLDITFADGSPAIVCGNPTAGTFAPSNPLSVFSGLDTAGDWTLNIIDNFSVDTGVLNDWSIEACAITLDATEFDKLNNFSVFPNPNDGAFTVKLNNTTANAIHIDVFDLRGRAIFSKTYKNIGAFKEILNLKQAQSGMYILTISDGIRRSTKKIVIE